MTVTESTGTVSTATASDLVERVRSLGPLVDQHRERLDRERAMPDEITAELIEAQLFRLWTPRDMGGLELDPVDGLRVISEVARLDGSVGWNVMLLGAYSFFSGLLEQAAAEEIYGPPDAAVGGQISPTGGHARPVEGGYRATGRWPFGSGSGQATWLLGHCAIEAPEQSDGASDERPETIWAFARASECEIHDTWRTSGLRGTASHDYSMDGVFIPESFVLHLPADGAVHDAPLYRFPTRSLLVSAVAAVPLGIARAAIDAFVELAQEKRMGGGGATYAEREVVQMDVARAENLLGAARALLFQSVNAVWETALRGEQPTPLQSARVNAACAYVGASCAEAVDIVYTLGGSSSIFEDRKLERCFRDVHTARQHAAVSDKLLIAPGRIFLGEESEAPRASV